MEIQSVKMISRRTAVTFFIRDVVGVAMQVKKKKTKQNKQTKAKNILHYFIYTTNYGPFLFLLGPIYEQNKSEINFSTCATHRRFRSIFRGLQSINLYLYTILKNSSGMKNKNVAYIVQLNYSIKVIQLSIYKAKSLFSMNALT